jgi:hypothetical protein
MSSLRVLWLNDNQLPEIVSDTFKGLTSLRVLWLSDNQISKISPGIFEGLTSLQELSLGNNQISEIAPGIFEELVSLKVLRLENNQISDIHPHAFLGMSSLEGLALCNNKISKIALGTFEELSSLQLLWLDGNQISEIPDGVYKNCKIYFHPQNVVLIKECKQISKNGGEEVACSISYDPIGDGCEYRMCSNPIKQHYILSEHWESWEKTCGNSKCVVCKEYGVVSKIFINT